MDRLELFRCFLFLALAHAILVSNTRMNVCVRVFVFVEHVVDQLSACVCVLVFVVESVFLLVCVCVY